MSDLSRFCSSHIALNTGYKEYHRVTIEVSLPSRTPSPKQPLLLQKSVRQNAASYVADFREIFEALDK